MNRAARRAARYKRPKTDRNRRTPEQANAWARLIEDVRPYDAGDMTENFVRIRVCFERLRTGVGDELDFDLVSKHVNMGMLRAEQIDPDLVAIMARGQQALVRTKARRLRGLALGFDAQGLQDLPAAIDVFEVIAEASSPQQMQQAITEMFRRIRHGHILEVNPV